eukprot:3848755-Ditylum_brightwellii.AAC.1
MEEKLSASSDRKASQEDLESGSYEQFIQENETKEDTKDYLNEDDKVVLSKVHPLFHQLSKTIRRSSHRDFSPTPEYYEVFQEQDAIPLNKIVNFAAAAIHYNFHIPSVIRFA